MPTAISKAIEWRLRKLLGDAPIDRTTLNMSLCWRALAGSARVFFGIAGSVGKTTAKEILLGVLAARAGVVGNRISFNRTTDIANTILRLRPWHRYCVAELGETGPDSLDELLNLLRPAIGLITTIGDDHQSAFGSRDAVAREFAKLAHALPAQGTLVLNHDDERVLALRHEASCRVITYGTAPGADLQARDIVSAWPEPLGFLATFNGEAVPVRTRLHGRHLLPSALAAIAGGLAAGLTLSECARGAATVQPTEGRMQPVLVPGGLSVIRDDFKSPAWTVRALFAQLRDARARRKILVLGTISDCQHKEVEISKLAREALAVADIAIFTGRLASAALKARDSGNAARLFAFSHSRDALELLKSIRQEGDLIVIKGTNKKDHLSRIALALAGKTANCWVDDCGRDMFCAECSHLKSHRGPPGLSATADQTEVPPEASLPSPPIAGPGDQFVIGLGNPGPEFAGTPHNVGQEALDALSTLADSPWVEYADAWIAKMPQADRRLWLIKLKTPMNLSGSALRRLSDTMGFETGRCILVFDDINLPLGKVRTRMDGSSGGHRGVTSILEAFQTNAFRRVKIGVRSTQAAAPAVLQRFDDEAYATIRQAFPVVAEHVRQLTARR